HAVSVCLFFLNNRATTAIHTLSLHDALPISDDLRAELRERIDRRVVRGEHFLVDADAFDVRHDTDAKPTDTATEHRERIDRRPRDRKSTRLNSSHVAISYAVFCLKKKKKTPA